MKKNNRIIIPADVPSNVEQEYHHNYQAITGPNRRLFLFAADQKIEHLNDDFYGPKIPSDVQPVHHLFDIASQGTIGAMATHLGLIARYGKQYPSINYIVKLNAKTNLIPSSNRDPMSEQLWNIKEVNHFKKQSKLNICGIGLTIYLGSEFEAEMLHNAANAVFEAHQYGLIAIIWAYVRGKNIKDPKNPLLTAGATGIATSLGADFVKIKPPHSTKSMSISHALSIACTAAGNTKVICSGQEKIEAKQFLANLYEQLQSGTAGCAVGRNIFQRTLPEAVAMTKAIANLVYENSTVEQALTYIK